MTDTPIRLLIVDDHNLFRQGLTRILEDYPQLNVVGQAADGGEALAMVDTLQPDV
ncbi:MAG TPA: response regulator, partial [Anaerolineae bacterium]|nr:response regulator [Anaerolineae bacterium]